MALQMHLEMDLSQNCYFNRNHYFNSASTTRLKRRNIDYNDKNTDYSMLTLTRKYDTLQQLTTINLAKITLRADLCTAST